MAEADIKLGYPGTLMVGSGSLIIGQNTLQAVPQGAAVASGNILGPGAASPIGTHWPKMKLGEY
jgi:hypothetical protein